MTSRALTSDELDTLFDGATSSIVRVEAFPSYDVGGDEAESLAAHRAGRARPERSIRTDPYLREVAQAVLRGVTWERLRVIDDPPTEYQRWELISYQESQAAGEIIRLVAAGSPQQDRGEDFWLFDHRCAAVLHYTLTGTLEWIELVDDPPETADLAWVVDQLRSRAVALNDYVAARAVARAS